MPRIKAFKGEKGVQVLLTVPERIYEKVSKLAEERGGAYDAAICRELLLLGLQTIEQRGKRNVR